VTQATPVNAPNASFTFNAPKSEHRGVELAADWKFYPGWRFTLRIPISTSSTPSTPRISSMARTFSFNRAGNKIPGVSPNELTARLGYDQCRGAAARPRARFVEVQWKIRST
jgi:iron complex outermembrane receptor protein